MCSKLTIKTSERRQNDIIIRFRLKNKYSKKDIIIAGMTIKRSHS